jgi:hypothetical protein
MRLKKILFLLSLCFFAGSVEAQSVVQEENLKAAFIYNFTKYIDWSDYNNSGVFIIGVIGPSPIIMSLNEIAKTNTVNNKRIIIKLYNKPEDIEYCNILFIPEKNPYPLQSILDKINKGTLTISEENGFAKQGTAFNFVVKNDKLKFETNLKALYLADLKAGSQLLKLAIIVN